jgi:hypothetical protein
VYISTKASGYLVEGADVSVWLFLQWWGRRAHAAASPVQLFGGLI